MEEIQVMDFKRDEGIKMPTKAHETDAAFDIYSPVTFTLHAKTLSHRIDLGVGFKIIPGYAGFVVERSSQGKIGLKADFGPLVDSGYTGNIHATLVNFSNSDIEIKKDERICQIFFPRVGRFILNEVDSFEETERGSNGHGSSGK